MKKSLLIALLFFFVIFVVEIEAQTVHRQGVKMGWDQVIYQNFQGWKFYTSKMTGVGFVEFANKTYISTEGTILSPDPLYIGLEKKTFGQFFDLPNSAVIPGQIQRIYFKAKSLRMDGVESDLSNEAYIDLDLRLRAYKGTPFSIPCKLEAEDFDIGGEGIAYHDVVPGNQGGVYRNEDVDIEQCSEGGFNVGYISSGEWLTYSINVGSSEKYDFILRVASAVIGTKKIHIEIDGIDVTGPLSFTDASGWQAWKDLKAIGINLVAGNHLMKVVFDTGNHNLNYINVVRPELPVAIIIVPTIRSEVVK